MNKNDWKFDEKISFEFDDHISKSIPGYIDIKNICIDLCEWFISNDSVVYDIGSSTGSLLASLKDTYGNRKNVLYKGYDVQIAMKGSNYNGHDVIFENYDVTELESFERASVILSIFTIQFIQENKREELLNKIYTSLPKGGLFLLAEKFNTNNSRISEIKKSLLLEHKLNNGFSEKEILEKDRSLRGVMKLDNLECSLNKLKKIGFKEVETLYLNNNFALHACIK